MNTESQIEEQLIEQLKGLKYKYRPDIKDRQSLEQNFKKKWQSLNQVRLPDHEFRRLRDEIIEPDVFSVSKRLRKKQYFQLEDGTPLHYTLINLQDWCRNDFEVIHQLRINTENSNQRYDVILLINGLPMVQIELKRSSIPPRKAMKQIVDYKSAPGNGYGKSLMCFIQLFIVSNRADTYYFANNNRKHFQFNENEQFLPIYQLADQTNQKIQHLVPFTENFLSKCTLGEMISKYIVLVESEQKLLVMRSYQMYAVKAIIDCIQQDRGNGYIWHTTGSGKTLTSFKAATLLKDNPEIEKCLFVVDRKDLDRQTREEFNKFQEGSVDENPRTDVLVRRLRSCDYSDKVIVTTIQKLGLALRGNKKEEYKKLLQLLQDKRMVFIFDECHRSQFGENHRAIKAFFPRAQLFGFTGTPIFERNAIDYQIENQEKRAKTTESLFEKELHAYTISDAFKDKSVLGFKIEFPIGEALTPRTIVREIIAKHPAITNQYAFNALLATASIADAITYYQLFKEIQQTHKTRHPDYRPLKIACLFSPPPHIKQENKDSYEHFSQEQKDYRQDPEKKKQALIEIIADYNQQFKTDYRISEFNHYYQDVQSRIKSQQYKNTPPSEKVDIVIVVDMLLTGFDSKYLNTLYVDKELKYHGLIQALSRTNRVLNRTKPHGNIMSFRVSNQQIDEAISLFCNSDLEQARKYWIADPATVVIEEYRKAVQQLEKVLQENKQEEGLVNEPQGTYLSALEIAEIAFLNSFKEVQRIKIQLDQYTDLLEEQKATIEALLSKEQFQKHRQNYLKAAQKMQEVEETQKSQTPEDIQQLDNELVLFHSVIIDYEYILNLVTKTADQPQEQRIRALRKIVDLIRSHSNLIEQKEDLLEYFEPISEFDWSQAETLERLMKNIERFRVEKYQCQQIGIAQKHRLKPEALKTFVETIITRMIFDGEKLTELMEPLDLDWKERGQAETALMKDLIPVLKKFAQGDEISGLSAYE